ncbi:MAG: hypothetical protein ABSF91_11900 [Bacteroidota bacterium]|jgi:hypothetical protein
MHKITLLPCKSFLLVASALGLAGIVPLGCLSVSGPPNEYDNGVNVLAVVTPDSMQAGETYRIQICFQDIPCGTFTHNVRATNGNQVYFTPIMHFVSQANCPPTGQVQTVTDTVRFSSAGAYQLVVSGLNGNFVKAVKVLPSFPRRSIYSFRFRFLSVSDTGKGSPDFSSPFSFLNRPPTYTFPVTADYTGEWDTTFVDTLPRIRYTLQLDTLEALLGIKEDGIILVP